MNEIAEKGTEGGEKNASAELSTTGMRSRQRKRDCNNGAVRNAGKRIDTRREKTADR